MRPSYFFKRNSYASKMASLYSNGPISEATVSAPMILTYRQVSNIRRTLAGNKIVDHSDVVGASPVGAAPTTSSFST